MAQRLFSRGDRVTVTVDGEVSYALVVGWNRDMLMVVDHPLAGDVVEIDLDRTDVEVALDWS